MCKDQSDLDYNPKNHYGAVPLKYDTELVEYKNPWWTDRIIKCEFCDSSYTIKTVTYKEITPMQSKITGEPCIEIACPVCKFNNIVTRRGAH